MRAPASWDVTVVLVTHDGPGDRVRACVNSVTRAGGHQRLVVVDNNEQRGASALADLAPDAYGAGVDAVITMPNRGYGAAANRGAEWGTAHRVSPGRGVTALLNDDTEVTAGWLQPLLNELDRDPLVGAVQPKLLLADNGRVNSLGVVLDNSFAGSDIGYGEPDDATDEQARDIDLFTGGAVVLRDEFLDATGGFDESYFLYYEDVDLALRGSELGWRYRCVPASVVHHAQGSSTGDLGDRTLLLQERNRLRAAVRFGDPGAICGAFWLSVRRLRHPPRTVHCRALLGGLAGTPSAVARRARQRIGR